MHHDFISFQPHHYNFNNIKNIIIFREKMSQHVKDIQLNPVKSTIIISIPIIVLLFLDALYCVIDLYWIDGLGTSAVICMGYITNFIYTLTSLEMESAGPQTF